MALNQVTPVAWGALACVSLIIAAMACKAEAAVSPRDRVGCLACHGRLTDRLPASHPPAEDDIETCRSCHRHGGPAAFLGWIVHLRHFAASEFQGDCWSCHVLEQDGDFRLRGVRDRLEMRVSREAVDKAAPFFRSWARSSFLDHRHAEKRVICRDCHGGALGRIRAGYAQCLGCHGSYQQLAQRTWKLNPNPHDSHLGEIRCTLCHKSHAPSELYCIRCHDDFDLKPR